MVEDADTEEDLIEVDDDDDGFREAVEKGFGVGLLFSEVCITTGARVVVVEVVELEKTLGFAEEDCEFGIVLLEAELVPFVELEKFT